MEYAQRLDLHARFDIVERAIDDAFGDGLLSVEHNGIHELGEDDIPELRIGKDLALLGTATTSHWMFPFSSASSGTCPGLTLVWLFRTLGAVLGARLPAILDALRVQHAAKDVVAHAGKDRKSTRLNSSHMSISYAVFCLKKK